MFECKLCKKKFRNITGLVSHLTHPKSACKTNIQEYYNKYHRKPNEGKCIICNNDMGFLSLLKGYTTAQYCKHCKNLNPIYQQKRKKTFRIKNQKTQNKKLQEESTYPYPCQLCNRKFKSQQGLSRHISQIHKDYSIQKYYDEFLKKSGEGICPITKKLTRFNNIMEGYFKYSGKGTCSSDKKIRQKIERTILKNYGVTNPIFIKPEKRIQKFKETYQKRRDLKDARIRLINTIRALTIDKNNKKQCQICGKIFNSISSLTTHVHKSYKIPLQEYYDKFFKKEDEGICPISNKQTNFDSVERGYFQYKNGYQQNAPEIIQKSKDKQRLLLIKSIIEKQHNYNVSLFVDQLIKVADHIDILCLKCNQVYNNSWYNLQLGYGKCPKCFPRNTHISKAEHEISEYIISLTNPGFISCSNYGVIKNPKTGRPLELDINIPSKKIAIEHNGLYWHSEQIISDPNYHLIKTKECQKQGIQLIHIFEDEWNNKKEIIKKMLKHKMGLSKQKIYARKCTIKEIEPKVKNQFLIENHIQGKDTSRIKLGAFYKDKLVAVMTFGLGNITRGGNPNNKLVWELNRFATKYHVIGIAGKFLKHFQRNFEWEKIYSYADLRWSTGNVYKQLGFIFIHQTQPNYWYIKDGRRIHRFSLRKRPDEPKDIPEWRLRYEEGYFRIWDCGHLKFELENNKKGHIQIT